MESISEGPEKGSKDLATCSVRVFRVPEIPKVPEAGEDRVKAKFKSTT